MQLRVVGFVAIAAIAVACKKAPDGGAGSGPASGSAAATGGSGAAAEPGGQGSGPAAAATGSGSGSSPAGSAAAGAAAPDSAAGSGAGSGTAASGDGAAPYNKAAFLADPLCVQVADKIRECVTRPEFIAALDDGASAQQKKVNASLRKGVAKWQSSFELCHNAWDILNYEYTGFLDQPAVFKAPGALASCAALGAAVKAGGGLVGGKTAE